MKNQFVTAINCMDGRTQLPVIEFLKQKYGADYVDTITEPGPVKLLSDPKADLGSIKSRVAISVNKHGSKVIAIVAHHDCAGNPVSKEAQLEQIKASCAAIKKWDFPVTIIGLWVDESWQVSVV